MNFAAIFFVSSVLLSFCGFSEASEASVMIPSIAYRLVKATDVLLVGLVKGIGPTT